MFLLVQCIASQLLCLRSVCFVIRAFKSFIVETTTKNDMQLVEMFYFSFDERRKNAPNIEMLRSGRFLLYTLSLFVITRCIYVSIGFHNTYTFKQYTQSIRYTHTERQILELNASRQKNVHLFLSFFFSLFFCLKTEKFFVRLWLTSAYPYLSIGISAKKIPCAPMQN